MLYGYRYIIGVSVAQCLMHWPLTTADSVQIPSGSVSEKSKLVSAETQSFSPGSSTHQNQPYVLIGPNKRIFRIWIVAKWKGLKKLHHTWSVVHKKLFLNTLLYLFVLLPDWVCLLWVCCITINLGLLAIKMKKTEKYEW